MTLLNVDVTVLTCCVVFSNSQGGALFKAALLAKENGGNIKDSVAMKTLMVCLILLI